MSAATPMSASFIVETSAIESVNRSNMVAIVASIALHGLILGFGLPYFSQSKENTPEFRDVGVIELSQAEQSRLPDLNPQIPEASQIPDTSVSTIDSSWLDTPLIDPSSIPSSLPNLPPLEGLQSAPSASIPNIPQLPPMNVYSPPVASLPSRLPISSGIPAPPPPQLPNSQPFVEQSPIIQQPRPQFENYDNNLSLEQLRNASRIASQQRQQELENQQQMANLEQPRQIDADELRRRRDLALLGETLNRAESIRNSLTEDKTNTSYDEVIRNQTAWMAKNGIALGKEENIIRLEGNYPQIAASRNLQGDAIYGVTVDAQGNVVSADMIQSAGVPILNNQALEQIKNRSFANSSGQVQHYRVIVSFKPQKPNVPEVNNITEPKPNVRPRGNNNTVTPPKPQPSVMPENNTVTPPKPQPSVMPENNTVTPPKPQPSVMPENNTVTPPKPQPSVMPENNTVTPPKPQPSVVPENNTVTQPEPQPSVVPEDNTVTQPKPQPSVVPEDNTVTQPKPQPSPIPEANNEVKPEPMPSATPQALREINPIGGAAPKK